MSDELAASRFHLIEPQYRAHYWRARPFSSPAGWGDGQVEILGECYELKKPRHGSGGLVSN